MKYYFILKIKRLARISKEEGINPYLGLILSILIFTGLYYALFQNTIYAKYIFPIIALLSLNMYGGIERNEFLKNTFSKNNYKKIRIFENLITTLPFSLYLIFEQEFLIALILLAFGIGISSINKINTFQIVLPTPFGKKPFEFIVGFRNTFWLYLISYILTIISVVVGNFNLGAFALILIFLVSINFYTKPEAVFYIWVHSQKPVSFLINKIKIAFIHGLILSLPSAILLFVFYINNAHYLLIIEIIGLLLITTSLLGKYAYYPADINLIQGIILILSIFFPPLLLITIPYLFLRSKSKLEAILV